MQSMHIIDVDEASFQRDVVEQSMTTPVVVDFWAPWCGPCRMLGPTLEKLADEYDGGFVLAKLNVDENPNLSRQFRVQGIPAVKAFRGGRVVNEFVGALPEPRIRDWLKQVAPSAADQSLEEANSLLATRQWAEAETVLHAIRASRPTHGGAALGMVKALLAQGKGRESLALLEKFPNSDEVAQAQQMQPLAELLAEVEQDPEPADDTEAIYFNAARLLGRGNFAAGMDGLLEVLRVDKRYRNRQAHKVMLSLFALMGEDDPLTNEYRQDLANVLF